MPCGLMLVQLKINLEDKRNMHSVMEARYLQTWWRRPQEAVAQVLPKGKEQYNHLVVDV